jgi:hypothetical protein
VDPDLLFLQHRRLSSLLRLFNRPILDLRLEQSLEAQSVRDEKAFQPYILSPQRLWIIEK